MKVEETPDVDDDKETVDDQVTQAEPQDTSEKVY